MNRFDKLKIITKLDYISNINQEFFIQHRRGETLLYYKYKQERPYTLIVIVDYQNNELSIEFTAKILKDNYPHLIGADNIVNCLNAINEMNICQLDTEHVIRDAIVAKCDVTKDIEVEDKTILFSYVRQNITNYRRWIVRDYQGGITIENCVRTPRYKKRLILYDKARELRRAANNAFLTSLNNRQDVEQYFQNKLRVELNINTMLQVRELLEVEDNDLMTVLNSQTNPILSIVDEAIREHRQINHRLSLRDFERTLLLQSCNYDLLEVEEVVRGHCGRNTSIARAMQPYRDLIETQTQIAPQQTLRTLVR